MIKLKYWKDGVYTTQLPNWEAVDSFVYVYNVKILNIEEVAQ